MLGFVSFLSFLPPPGISLPLPPPSPPLPLPVPCLSLSLAQLLPRRASRPREERKLALPFPRNTPSTREGQAERAVATGWRVDRRRPGGARRCHRLRPGGLLCHLHFSSASSPRRGAPRPCRCRSDGDEGAGHGC